LEVGFGYLWKPRVVRPIASYALIPEGQKQPSLTLGLMYDSLGGGRQGAFLNLGKDLTRIPGALLSGYIGAGKMFNERGIRFLAGANRPLTSWLGASLQFDGRYANVGVTSRIGSIAGSPVQFGIVAAKATRFGPLVAVNHPIFR
jgi:hypothetical protein